MAFDGRDHVAAELVLPYHGHPHAPATGRALSLSLELAYLAARHNARCMGSVTYAADLRDRTRWRNLGTSFASTSYVRVAEARRGRLALEATHLIASAQWSVTGTGPVDATHRLVVTDGTNTDTGTAVVTRCYPVPQSSGGWGGGPRPADVQAEWLSPFRNTFEALLEVELDTVAAGDTVRWWIEGKAVVADTLSAVAYVPVHYTCAWEVRG